MSFRSKTQLARLLAAGVAVTLTGCAGVSTYGTRAPSPEGIPGLEERLGRDSTDTHSVLELATAYRAANRLVEAQSLLERVHSNDTTEPSVGLLLALTLEDRGDYAEARRLYESYAGGRLSARVRTEVARRLVLLSHRELKDAARDAVTREAELSSAPLQPRTLAVLPFLFRGENTSLRPLGRALSDMLVTDLSQTNRLEVLERAEVQYLLDEMRLEEGSLTSAATGIRAGQLLRAERLVQGSVDAGATTLGLEAGIFSVAPGTMADPVRETDLLDRLLDMEKELAFGLYGSLGIELTPAERELVSQRPTENVRALLLFGMGLEAEDAGDFATAARYYREASALDPSFSRARQKSESATDAAAAASTTTQAVAVQITALAAIGAIGGVTDLTNTLMLVPGTAARDPAPEVLGGEGIGRRATIDLIIRPR